MFCGVPGFWEAGREMGCDYRGRGEQSSSCRVGFCLIHASFQLFSFDFPTPCLWPPNNWFPVRLINSCGTIFFLLYFSSLLLYFSLAPALVRGTFRHTVRIGHDVIIATRTDGLVALPLCHPHQRSQRDWTMLSVVWSHFWLVLCGATRWTQWSLWVPSNWGWLTVSKKTQEEFSLEWSSTSLYCPQCRVGRAAQLSFKLSAWQGHFSTRQNYFGIHQDWVPGNDTENHVRGRYEDHLRLEIQEKGWRHCVPTSKNHWHQGNAWNFI